MNETEYITNLPPFQTTVFDNQLTADSEAVSEVTEVTAFTSVSSSSLYDMERIEQNTDGILLTTVGIFFLLVCCVFGKIFGGFFSM